MAVPFEQIGLGLRWLSLRGGLANGLALALWAGLCLLPLAPVLKSWQEKEKRAEHVLLILLSVMLFVMLYFMVNPGAMNKWLPEQMVSAVSAVSGGAGELLIVMKGALSMAVWSVVVCYVVFCLLRLFKAGEKEQLFRYVYRLLYALCGLFVGVMAITCMEFMSGVKAAQTAIEGAVRVVRALVAALPYGMDIIVTLAALNLLEAVMQESRPEQTRNAEWQSSFVQENAAEREHSFVQENATERERMPKPERTSEKVTETAHKLSCICCVGLAVVTASGAGLNLIQLIFSRKLYDINIHVEIPFMSLAFVLAALLFARLIEENRKLAEENEMFI